MDDFKLLCENIKSQQGEEGTDTFGIGEQLKDICKNSPKATELVLQDLSKKNMSLSDVAKSFKAYADENHGKNNSFCITAKKAEELIKKFYGIPEEEQAHTEKKSDTVIIDLEEFL